MALAEKKCYDFSSPSPLRVENWGTQSDVSSTHQYRCEVIWPDVNSVTNTREIALIVLQQDISQNGVLGVNTPT
jgi:hypothetical protein